MKAVSAATLLLLFSACSKAEVYLDERFTYYHIDPSEVAQIKLELRNKSPVSKANQTYHGGTEWTLAPNFRWQKTRNLCRIKDVRVRLNGTYTMPKLVSATAASAQTRERFDTYYNALLTHEKGHQDLWLKAGNEIERMLNNFEPFYSCAELSRQAKLRIAEVIHRYQDLNQAYDQTTGHGRTQGAVIR